jgi:hypothetical protein
MPAEIQIEGLAKLRRGLKEIDPQLQKDLRTALLPTANRVADTARGNVPSRTGRAASSIRGGISGNNAYVQGGRSTVPYFGWLDFGARTPKTGNPRTVGPWAGTGPGPARGRFIYPAIDSQHDAIERAAAQAIDDIIQKALPHES